MTTSAREEAAARAIDRISEAKKGRRDIRVIVAMAEEICCRLTIKEMRMFADVVCARTRET
jgi:hypothetical protein